MTTTRARLLLIAAVCVVFGRLLWCDFTWWDDWNTIHQNPGLNPVTWESFLFNWQHATASIYIPLTFTVWDALTFIGRVTPDEQGISLNASVFHAANILVHAGGALAAWSLLRRLVKNQTAALLGALLWALHPVQVESVGWVSGLKDVLSGTLVLTAMTHYVRWRQDAASIDRPPARHRPLHRHWPYAVALAAYALALLAKPSAFTMPLLLVVIDRLVFAAPWRKVAAALAAFVALTLPIALIARAAQPSPAAAAPPWVRPLVAGDTLAFYSLKIVAPIRLTFDYGRNIEWLRTQHELYFAWLLPAAAALGTAWLYRRAKRVGRPLSPLPAVGILCFVLAPLHVLGLTRFDFQVISVVADHYLYVAVIGPALLLAWAVARWPKWTPAAVAWVVLLAARSAWQTRAWQDDFTLMGQALDVNPLSWTAHTNLAVRYNKDGDFDAERTHLMAAQRIRPDDPNVLVGLIVFSLSQPDVPAAKQYARHLLDYYDRVYLPAGGTPAGAYPKVVDPFYNVGRYDDAAAYVNEALARDPNDPAMRQYAERIVWKRHADVATSGR